MLQNEIDHKETNLEPGFVSIKPKLIIAVIIVIFLLYIISRYNYLLFHSIVEGYSIVVAFTIYIIVLKTYQYSENNFLSFLGNAYFFIGVLDFLHLMTYKGMGVFPALDTNVPTQFWISGRYIEAISMFLAPLIINHQFTRRKIFCIYAIITFLVVSSIMYTNIFPVCYIPGKGLTSFKIGSEYLISLILTGSILNLYRQQKKINLSNYYYLVMAILITVLSELSFTLYVDVYGVMNMIGHIFKMISYYLIYRGIIVVGLETPYAFISKDLQESAKTDYLTGVYNRRGFVELMEKNLELAEHENLNFTLYIMDLNKFKELNDKYGHATGDKALQRFAEILKSAIRKDDIIGRFGGDEFVVLAFDDKLSADGIRNRINDGIMNLINKEEYAGQLSVSIGSATWKPGQSKDPDKLIREADQEMYKEKDALKNRV